MLGLLMLGVVACVASACGGDEKGAGAPGTTACDKAKGIAGKLGCTIRGDGCSLVEACESEYRALFDCIASDYSQCHCESDGGLNCEGAWKPDEGPARCIEEYKPMDVCEDANRG